MTQNVILAETFKRFDELDAESQGELKSWDKRESESDMAYEAFCCFRDIGFARTMKDATALFNRLYAPTKAESSRSGSFSYWSKEYDWNTRCAAWDAEQRSRRDTVSQDVLDEMAQRHLRMLREVQERGFKYLQENEFDTAAAALRALTQTMPMEQKLVGIPDITHLVILTKGQLSERYADIVTSMSNPAAARQAELYARTGSHRSDSEGEGLELTDAN
ncbi:hypothetical protein KKH23_05680 [Patescibacteria group bacterium]|nr:hypothetical protein [Patescibacteria group bacterium]